MWAAIPDPALRGILEAREAEALAALGISLDSVRRHVEETMGPDAWREAGRRRSRPAFSAPAKAALTMALREAVALHHRRIRPEHLLLGLLSQEGPAWEVLLAAGCSPEELRRSILAELGSSAA
jgi:ATP-dependent Clp protease ATP-binding subunit ClpA